MKFGGRKLFNQGSLLFALLASPVLTQATTVTYFVETGQTGAQTQLDIDHTSNWDFIPSWGWDLGGGIFTMKDGSQTNGTITLTLHDLTDSSTVTSVSLDQNSFSQSFSNVTFAFATPVLLTPGDSYELDLTSQVADAQKSAYFIKNDGASNFYDAQGNPLPESDPNSGLPTQPGAVPEPTTFSMLLIAVAGMFCFRHQIPILFQKRNR